MKIAVIGVKGLPAKQGGIEHYCQALYPKIVERGHTVDLYARASYIKQSWLSTYQHQGVRVICLPSLPIRGLDAFTSSGLAALVCAFRGYDVVHFHALGPSLFSFIPRLLSSAKIVATCQGLDWQRGKWGKSSSSVIRLGEKMAAKYAHNIIVVSRALQDYFKQTYDLDSVYIPNAPGIYAKSNPDFEFVKSRDLKPSKYFLFLGRLVPEKRPDLLLQAFRQLNQSDWKLVLAGGDSDTTEYISELVDLAKDNPNIIFAGELRGSRLAEMVRGAGVFVLPSDLEGLPLAMLEAMRERVPVVASDIPPHKQLIGSDRGTLFKAGSLISCVTALKKAINQPKQLASMAQKAQKYIQHNYTWEKITADNLSVYSQEFEIGQVENSTNDSPAEYSETKVAQSLKS
ncbi:MAG: glycosyltransferase family 4 protein [Pleurocapsa minor HA4230-MV1]|jgi:glycosyltransferase involved in cell wall biosynthesis|nr:glycosyltransferase family 4 protein [Pleurocapsa minor HA4230-MV1]